MSETFTNVNGQPLAYALLGLLASLFVLPLGAGPIFMRTNGYAPLENAKADDARLDVAEGAVNASGPDGKAAIGCRPVPWNATYYPFLRSLISIDFILIFLIFFLAIGAGITVVNNLPEIVIARLPESYSGKIVASKDLPHGKDKAALIVLVS
jgi:hypothetical protein